MYINHDDVVKLAAIDKAAKESQVKQPSFLGEVEREINVLYTTVRNRTSCVIKDISFLIVFKKDSEKQAKNQLPEVV